MVDCFMFFNELDLLEIRLNSLAPYVKKFIISESTHTFSGNPKRLFFEENKERFKDFNIVHLICDGGMNPSAGKNSGDAWRRENYQRKSLETAIFEEDPEEMIVFSDMDEIPNLKDYDGKSEGAFRQKKYYYYLNAYSGDHKWKGSIAVRRKNLLQPNDLNIFRDRRNKIRSVGNGWHFSTLGTPEDIKYKIESFAHVELNTKERKDRIEGNMKNLIDPYNRAWSDHRGRRRLTIEMPSGPEWLLKNKDRYPHLFYKGEK